MSDHKKAVPFGLEKGVKLDQLSFEIEEIGPCVYMTVNPPKPHSSFSSYILRVAPCSGLYWIKGPESVRPAPGSTSNPLTCMAI